LFSINLRNEPSREGNEQPAFSPWRYDNAGEHHLTLGR
jgi:hypothetical protein